MTFEGTLARLSTLSAEALATGRWTWREGARTAGARYAFDNAVEREHDAAVGARSAWRPALAPRILGLAQLAYGDLRGILLAIPDELVDREPGPGEWTVRQTCEHAIRVERSYRAGIVWALERTEDQPVLIPEERRPVPDPLDTRGSASDIESRFAFRRGETDRELRAITDTALPRPSIWRAGPGVEVTIDVRFRLHRLATHLQEHTIQIEKALDDLGWHPGDAPRAVRRLSVARAMHERISDSAVLAALDDDLEREASELGV